MKSSLLQKLLNKQKQNKFGDFVSNEKWDELTASIFAGTSKLEDVIVPIKEMNKFLSLFHYVTTLEPTQQVIGLLGKLIPIIDQPNVETAANMLKEMILTSGLLTSQLIDLIVRNLLTQEELIFSQVLNQLIDASGNFISLISTSLTKYFPQTSFDGTQQLYYLRSTLNVCSHCTDVGIAVLSRVFQHIVGLDCELMIKGSKEAGALEIDEDIAAILTPQIILLFDFIECSPPEIFILLLQLFDLYLIDLPSSSTVQFLFILAASFDASFAQKFGGFLLHKMIDNSVCIRTRGNAAFYLSTLVARARYIDDQFAAAILDYVINFASCYLKHVQTNSPQLMTRNVQQHAIFYYALQCIAYIMCWRGPSWRASGIDPEEKWKLSEIFVNDLDGLSAIDKNTAEMFGNLGIVEYDPEEIMIDHIDVWFPYDPCPLEEVQARVEPVYRQWGEEIEPGDVDAILDQSLNKIFASRGISFDDIFKQ